MADQMTTTQGNGPAEEDREGLDDAVQEAWDNLRQAMIDAGEDEGSVDAKLRSARPRGEPNLVGNFADLNRLGALVADSETDNASALETAVEIPPAAATDTGTGDGTSRTAADVNGDDDADLNSMTKADLQALADERGVEYASGDTKADLVSKLGG